VGHSRGSWRYLRGEGDRRPRGSERDLDILANGRSGV